MLEIATGLALVLAVLALAISLGSAFKARAHRMAIDRRLEEMGLALHEQAAAMDLRSDDLLKRIEKLNRFEDRLRLLEVRDLAGEWQRLQGLEAAQLARLAGALDRLRDDLRLEGDA